MNAREIQIPEDILALTLAFYREPARYQNLLSARVARDDGVQTLLRAAIGTGPDVSRELRNAALFAIEQLFFTQGANHYQILGLTPAANIGQVKLHHRLLMSLLHPDRSDARRTWMDAYAGRVNQAYNALRKPASRQAYDRTLGSTRHDRVSSQAHRDCGDDPPMPQSLALVRPNPFQRHAPGLIKHLPQLVLSAAAVLALLFVTWSYLANRTFFVAVRTEVALADNDPVLVPLLDFESPSSENKPGPSERDLNQRRLVPNPGQGLDQEARHAPMISPVREEAAAGVTPEPRVEPPVVVERPAREPRVLQSKSRVEQRGKREVALATGHNAQAMEMAVIPERQAQQQEARSREAKLPKAKRAQVTAEWRHQEAGVSVNDLKALMGRFVETYNRGDLSGFMTLFDERARTSSHYGKQAIRKDYEDFFSNTASRRLTLNGLHWRREGIIASGRGGFQVRVRMRDGLTLHDSRGNIRFEVRKRSGAVRIQGVYHEMN